MLRVFAFALSFVLLAQPLAVRANPALYQRVAPSTVAIYHPKLTLPHGSGVLIDADKRLVVTAAHVVDMLSRENNRSVRVVFPDVQNGKVVTDSHHYRRQLTQRAITGALIYIDTRRDVAVIQLQRVPDNVKAVPLAKVDPEPGETIHVIGNSSAAFGGMFGYNCGTVRNSFFWISDKLARYTLSHHAPTNKGDSGGPVVNDRGELVAIISEGTTGDSTRQGSWTHLQQVVDHSAHVREIRAVLELVGNNQFQQPSGQVLTVTGSMPALVPQRFADEFFVPVQKGQQLDVELSGAGQTDLDIVLLDDQGKKILERRGTSDKEKATLIPGWTGYCRILVHNYGGGADRYTLTARWTNPISGQFVSQRRLERKTTDSYQFFYPAGKTARMSIYGDGDTDLNLVVRDPKGNILARGIGPTDVEAVQWQTPMAGVYTVEVQNLGNIWNKYALMTD